MRDFKIYFSLATIALVIYLVSQFSKPSPVNWNQSLYYNDKIPYGTYIFYRQLDKVFPASQVTKTNQNFYDLTHSKSISNGNYLIIANYVDFSKYDYQKMVKYMQAGNSIFIAAGGWGGILADTLSIQTDNEAKQSHVGLNFTNSNLRQAKDYKFDRDITSEYFSNFDTAHAVSLGKNNLGHSNFLRFSYGKGALYLCSTPLLFTNYSLLSNRGADYAEKALSYLPVTNHIYWDEFENHDIMEDDSPFRVFFNHESLEWAFYITLIGLVFFIFYEKKRRQRIIPIIEPLKNATLGFVNVVGQVYYEQRDNKNMAQKKILYFLEYLRTKYYLKTNVLDAEFIERLSFKAGIEASFAREIVNQVNYIEVQVQVTDHELILLNQLIEQFYIKSGDNGRRII
jgi:hypothetical protein